MMQQLQSALLALFAPPIRVWGKLCMRLWGCRVARTARINGRPTLLMHKGTMTVGERVAITSIASIYEAGSEFPRCVFSTSPTGHIEIGDDSCLAGTVIVAHKSVTIGKRVMIGAGCRIIDTNFHPIDVIPRRYTAEPEPSPIVIEDDVWLGLEVLVLPGVRIGRGSVIGARSVVTQDIPPLSVAAGIPAKVIRPLDLK